MAKEKDRKAKTVKSAAFNVAEPHEVTLRLRDQEDPADPLREYKLDLNQGANSATLKGTLDALQAEVAGMQGLIDAERAKDVVVPAPEPPGGP